LTYFAYSNMCLISKLNYISEYDSELAIRYKIANVP